MQTPGTERRAVLSSVIISPDREIAAQFCASTEALRAFEILLDIKNYPSEQTLDIRVRQLQPELVLVDVASNLDAALEVISHLVRTNPDMIVVALDRQGASDAIIRTLRAGASEFLYSPFDPAGTSQAIARLLQLRKADPEVEQELGTICVFSSVKPGSGSSTLAAQTAFAIRRLTSKRVLLADFDLMGGTIGFYLKVHHAFSVVEAIGQAGHLNRAAWTSLVGVAADVDILCAPPAPYAEPVDTDSVQALLDYTRTIYDWVVVDLPVVFQRTSLITLPQADTTFLVSTSELPSLHLARKSITMMEQLGFPRDRFQVVVNRVGKRDRISRTDMENIFHCPVHASFPNDYFPLHRAVTVGEPLSADTELGKAIENFAAQLARPMAARTAPQGARPLKVS